MFCPEAAHCEAGSLFSCIYELFGTGFVTDVSIRKQSYYTIKKPLDL
jgi:hypothetical protein